MSSPLRIEDVRLRLKQRLREAARDFSSPEISFPEPPPSLSQSLFVDEPSSFAPGESILAAPADAEVSALEERCKALERLLSEREREMDKLRDALDRPAAEARRSGEADRMNADLRDQNRALEERQRAAEEQVRSLAAQLQERSDLARELARKVKDLEDRLKEKENVLSESRRELAAADRVRAEMEGLKARIQETGKDGARLLDLQASLEKTILQLEETREKHAASREILRQVESDCAAWKDRF